MVAHAVQARARVQLGDQGDRAPTSRDRTGPEPSSASRETSATQCDGRAARCPHTLPKPRSRRSFIFLPAYSLGNDSVSKAAAPAVEVSSDVTARRWDQGRGDPYQSMRARVDTGQRCSFRHWMHSDTRDGPSQSGSLRSFAHSSTRTVHRLRIKYRAGASAPRKTRAGVRSGAARSRPRCLAW